MEVIKNKELTPTWSERENLWSGYTLKKAKNQKIYESMIQFLLKWNICLMYVHVHTHMQMLAMFISVGELGNV